MEPWFQPGKWLTKLLALAALLHCQAQPLPFIHAAFRAYWVDHANLDDLHTVKALLEKSDADPDGFSAAAALEQLDTVQAEAMARGVIDTPAYIVDEQLFIGREHLPWIRSILSDQGAA